MTLVDLQGWKIWLEGDGYEKTLGIGSSWRVESWKSGGEEDSIWGISGEKEVEDLEWEISVVSYCSKSSMQGKSKQSLEWWDIWWGE